MRKIITIISLIFAFPKYSLANKNEKYYQTIHCNKLNGEIEYQLKDKTRVDCLTQNDAIEYDFAKKWAECLGQALYYGAMQDKTPVCALIGSEKEFRENSSRIKFASEYYKLPVKTIHIEK